MQVELKPFPIIITHAHVTAVRNARFVAVAALAAYQGPTNKRRDEAKSQVYLLAEVTDFLEAAIAKEVA